MISDSDPNPTEQMQYDQYATLHTPTNDTDDEELTEEQMRQDNLDHQNSDE